MQVVVSKEALAKGVTAVQRAVSARAPLPILSHIKLLAEVGDGGGAPSGAGGEHTGGRLVLTATDLEIGLEVIVPATVSEPGGLCLVARTLGEILAKLPAADVSLAAAAGTAEVVLRCERSRFTLRGQMAAEFPELPRPSGVENITIAADQLIKGVKQTVFAAAGEEKAIISGVFASLANGRLEMVATDGFRLASRGVAVESTEGELSVVVPRRAMDELARQVGASGATTVTLVHAHQQLAVRMGDRYMTTRLVDGQYPNYRQIIPPAFEREAEVDRAHFLAAVERVGIMASDREAHTIKLEFTSDGSGGGELRLAAGNSELGESDEVLAIGYRGEGLAISFNGDFLADALRHMDASVVVVRLNGPLMPVILRPLEDDGQFCLVMPLNR